MPFLQFVGIGTEFVFKHRKMPPGGAVFSVYSEDGVRALVTDYYAMLVELGREFGTGVILDVPTWDAHTARGLAQGMVQNDLHEFNRLAVSDAVAARDAFGDLPTVIAASVGPRDDAFKMQHAITEQEAENYHLDQMQVLADTEIDLIDAFTLPSEIEAVGMVRAARSLGLPIVVSFTLATDGRLPFTTSLEQAIRFVDEKTDAYASYFLVNCVHPVHFPLKLTAPSALNRLRGIVANASHADHADLDEAGTLDSGDQHDLGVRIGQIAEKYPHFKIFGGCCGTDMSHLRQIARQTI